MNRQLSDMVFEVASNQLCVPQSKLSTESTVRWLKEASQRLAALSKVVSLVLSMVVWLYDFRGCRMFIHCIVLFFSAMAILSTALLLTVLVLPQCLQPVDPTAGYWVGNTHS